MFKNINLLSLDDFFLSLNNRKGNFVFFYRFNGISNDIIDFIKQYYMSALQNGVIIDGRIPNPTPENLSYLSEMLGSDFMLDKAFLDNKLKKWLPRMSDLQRNNICSAIFSTFEDMLKMGKNQNIIKNAYIKYMCWLYYKFERIVGQLGADNVPKILYLGDISQYELQLLIALSRAGADIVLLNSAGEQAYLKLDPKSEFSTLYNINSGFPKDFTLKQIQKLISDEQNRQRIFGENPNLKPCTNAWFEKPELSEILKTNRGDNKEFFYNAFIVQYGVEDTLLFSSDMCNFYQNLKNRNLLVINNQITPPSTEEINAIKRNNYQNIEQLASHLSQNISYPNNKELEKIMKKTFIDILLNSQKQNTIQKLTSKAVYLLCWLKRYQKDLFANWNINSLPAVFILFHPSPSANEELFLNFLSHLPVDVLVIMPDLSQSFTFSGENLLEIRYTNSISITAFPSAPAKMKVSTAAYQAEREMDTLLYSNSGMYRDKQHSKADIITLQTMYEEIFILWEQELKYRTGFSENGESVNVPVLFSKISGVKNGQISDYWLNIKKLITQDTIVINSLPWVSSFSPMKQFATQFLQNGRLQKNKIKSHKNYQYNILRNEMQEHLLDKIQVMLDEKLIRGTYQNGTEYTIIATALNLDKNLLRIIQKFDFTKKNPKLLFILTSEKTFSLEESILVAFLHLIGFDILFFVPTGYQCIEGYFNQQIINEYQIGDYIYDLHVPNFNEVNEGTLSSILKRFGRSF